MRTVRHDRGFSLVELVIVVVIIGVIAAIAVPRISRGAKGAGDASLRGSLAGMRNAIDMYAAEHGGTYPAGVTQLLIEDKLLKKTDAQGNTGVVLGTHIYGPYLRAGFPAAPVGANKGNSTIKIVTGDPVANAASEATGEGWIYSTDTGKIVLNTDDTDEQAVAYSSY